MTDTDLNGGPVWRALARVSAPMTLGILGVLSVGIADSYVLARAGQTELTAIGFVYPIIVALTSLSIGLSAGANTVVSQSLGRGTSGDETRRLALHGILLAFVAAAVTAGAFRVAAPALFGLLGAEGAVLEAILAYVDYWCLSFPFLAAGMVTNAVFRSGGKGAVAAIVMLTQSAINIALDPLLIFGVGPVPAMGIEGAGLATLIARVISAVLVIGYAWGIGLVRLDCAPFEGAARSVRRIGRVAGPAALANAINPAGMAAVTGAVAILGEAAVAGFGAATRIQSLAFVPLLALSAGIGPVVGQAWGAERHDRAREATRLTFLLCLGYGLAAAALLSLLPGPIAALITDGSEAQGFTADYLRIVSWSFFGYGIVVTANAAMNARDKAVHSMLLSAARIGLVYVPGAYIAVRIFGYPGILGAAVLANLLAVWGALVLCNAVGLLRLGTAPVSTPARRVRALSGET